MKSDYYIYVHRGLKTNTVFYLGKGRGIRSKVKAIRPKYWKDECVKQEGYTVEYLYTDLTEKDALDKEEYLLNNPDNTWSLINKQKVNKFIDIDYTVVNSIFYVDPTSSSGLRWKIKPAGTPKQIDDIAGNVFNINYWQVSVKGQSFLAHRVVYILSNPTEDIKLKVINHKNCNPSNNNILNLEAITQVQNLQRTKLTNNLVLSKANITGVNGVTFVSQPNCDLYLAYIYIDVIRKTKCFACKKYGKDKALELAIQARKIMETGNGSK